MNRIVFFHFIIQPFTIFASSSQPSRQFCKLESEAVFDKLLENDWHDTANPAYRRPKAEPFCKTIFELCPVRFSRKYRNMGKVKEILFRLHSEYVGRRYICRYIEPAVLNQGRAGDPYYWYKEL